MWVLYPVAIFLLQLFVILSACRGAGWVACRLGQPRVVGEMIAGVLLGPSLFGLVAPAAQAWLFRADSMRPLYLVAQIGVGLYMFLVGVEFRTEVFRARVRGALAVSFAGMAVPFLIAVALTPWLCDSLRFSVNDLKGRLITLQEWRRLDFVFEVSDERISDWRAGAGGAELAVG